MSDERYPCERSFPETTQDMGLEKLPAILPWMLANESQIRVEDKGGDKLVCVEVIPPGGGCGDALVCRQIIPPEAFARYKGSPADVLGWRIRIAIARLTNTMNESKG